ncbi:hypothetical protein BO70DRAFT_296479 [Aspergillus heteromorphus CBS 117.55]|uniref:Ribosomal protein S35, mitochondrial n=1 Tax=Aspergillus heteromorphus CBS 117.55 TaxID=1448321 RepID=A0A317VLC9_9EURO|nr:uncharacterized protein BO70DRAFT_296479 [Aspergillus heteromorphus CBS 117.55]PWY75146.1 hypothetical protein BO70DRAFT_296479 [Aspergillus heteromorphus CBS 117.55]
MAPRIQNQVVSNTLLPYLSSSSTSTCLPRLSTSSSQALAYSPRSSCRSFSSSVAPQTRQRREMFQWLSGPGARFKNHVPGETNYLTARKTPDGKLLRTSRPFIDNQQYRSEPILSVDLQNEIYDRVVKHKKSVRAVSVELDVDMRRVAAVVRLMELQKKMTDEGKSLALPYGRAIHEMLEKTEYEHGVGASRSHENINDLPSHRLTHPQIFYPVSESRQFNRVDAGRVFSGAPALEHEEVARNAVDPYAAVTRVTHKPSAIEMVGKGDEEHQVLQPADTRIPHPHLVAKERDSLNHPEETYANRKVYNERLRAEEKAQEDRRLKAEERRAKRMLRVQPEDSRFEFRIQDVVVSRETTGKNGRGAAAPGRRYGVPANDRKKGEVKIPTRVVV